MRTAFAAWLLSLCLVLGAHAQEAAAPPDDAATAQLGTIVVTGEQPGPGLWKVSKGDHVLWVLGTLAPLPKDMQWRATEVGERIAQSQAVLMAPAVGIKAKAGFWGTIALMPSLIGLRNNPDGKRLEEVVPADLYARWKPLKERYLGRSDKVEKWRPLFAAMELYRAAIRKNGMSVGGGAISDTVEKAAKKTRLKPTPVELQLAITVSRKAVKDFKQTPLDDLECFARTIERLESDLQNMKLRANAWATGDLEALRGLPSNDQFQACNHALESATLMQEQGDVMARVKQVWLEAASSALDAHASSVSLLPMRLVIGPESYLSALRERGYRVQAPDEADDTVEAALP